MHALPLRYRWFFALATAGTVPLLLLPLLGLGPAAALWLVPAVWVLVYPIALWLARPAEEVLDTARRLRGGDLKARAFLENRESDWGRLGATLGDLAERLDQVTRTLDEQVSQRTAALARKAEQLRAVSEVGRQVAAVLEPDALLHFVVRVMRGAFGYDLVAVLQGQNDHLVLTACAARGLEEAPLGRVFALRGTLAEWVRGAGGMSGAPTPLVAVLPAQTELGVPLRLGDRVLGALVVQSRQEGALDEEDLFTLRTIAGQVAVALENARLFEAERQLRDLAVTEERNRMAREIHDTLAQGFMGIIMQLRAMAGAADADTARFHREQAEALARESLQEARRSVWNLRPQTLEGRGLAGALAAEVAGLQRRMAVRAEFTTTGPVERIGFRAEAALLRIGQEALHNAVKYARAGFISVTLAVADDTAELVVADDGVGFEPGAAPRPDGVLGGGTGLAGMADRARELGGTVSIESAPGEGCRVVARIPVGEGGR